MILEIEYHASFAIKKSLYGILSKLPFGITVRNLVFLFILEEYIFVNSIININCLSYFFSLSGIDCSSSNLSLFLFSSGSSSVMISRNVFISYCIDFLK